MVKIDLAESKAPSSVINGGQSPSLKVNQEEYRATRVRQDWSRGVYCCLSCSGQMPMLRTRTAMTSVVPSPRALRDRSLIGSWERSCCVLVLLVIFFGFQGGLLTRYFLLVPGYCCGGMSLCRFNNRCAKNDTGSSMVNCYYSSVSLSRNSWQERLRFAKQGAMHGFLCSSRGIVNDPATGRTS